MPQTYVYVDGSDLHEVESLLLSKFKAFVSAWGMPATSLINDKLPRTPDLGPDDLPEWNLGLNFDSLNLSQGQLEELFAFLISLSAESGREFIVGTWQHEFGISEDLAFISSKPKPNTLNFLIGQLCRP